jgi:hypothetical protein
MERNILRKPSSILGSSSTKSTRLLDMDNSSLENLKKDSPSVNGKKADNRPTLN